MSQKSLAIIACYFNYGGYKLIKDNYFKFKEGVERTGYELFTIEVAFDDKPFDLPAGPNTLQLRSNTVLWYKENLINVMVSKLPDYITKVAWIDADLLYSDDTWAQRAETLLDEYKIVQMFEYCEDLDSSGNIIQIVKSVASLKQKIETCEDWRIFRPGWAWAARRDFFTQVGLFDKHIMGSNDSWFVVTVLDIKLHNRFYNLNSELMAAYDVWSNKVREYISSTDEVGVLRANIQHLWHGDKKDRQYIKRQDNITNLNPYTDLTYNEDGLLTWTDIADEEMIHLVKQYFLIRNDDGLVGVNQTAVVSAIDSKFFKVFPTWLAAIRNVWNGPIVIYDLGLTPEQTTWCVKNGINPIKHRFDTDIFTHEEIHEQFKDKLYHLNIWKKPFLINKCQYNKILWIDVDAIVLEPLYPLIEMMNKQKFVVFKDTYNPSFCINGNVESVLPYNSTNDPSLTFNTGILAIDKSECGGLLYNWLFACKQALTKPEVEESLKCFDQGALIWATRICVMDKCMINDMSWNCPANKLTAVDVRKTPRKKYGKETALKEIRRDHPNVNIVYWMGNGKFFDDWED